MDQSVLDALKRWPNVPAVYGWLSLTARGEWKLHPLGDAQSMGPGQGITNTQILGFINRNYAAQADGAWFFQNGPQRVYVRLDAAPLILHIHPHSQSITTHNGHTVRQIKHWYCDENGHLYAQTDCGPGRIDDRDLQILAEVLHDPSGLTLFELFDRQADQNQSQTADSNKVGAIECGKPVAYANKPTQLLDPQGQYPALVEPADLSFVDATQIPLLLGFIPNPGADSDTSPDLGRKMRP